MPSAELDRSRPMVTIFADASFKDGIAGWGCWIKANEKPSITQGGPFKNLVRSVDMAEFMALGNAIFVAKTAAFLSSPCIVMLQSDSATALASFRMLFGCRESYHRDGARIIPRSRPFDPEQALIASCIEASISDLDLQWLVRHVRGHQPGHGRNWVNRKCDELAFAGRLQAERNLRHAKTS